MNTHLIIPIKDIESFIAKKDALAKSADDFNVKTEIYATITGMEQTLKLGKQISLDEKDIEEKAEKYGRGNDWPDDRSIYSELKQGYKQALKDLL